MPVESTLPLFGLKLMCLASSRVADITLEGCEPILPGVKMTLMMPIGGLEEVSPMSQTLIGLHVRLDGTKDAATSFL